MKKQRISFRLSSFDHRLLDEAVSSITRAAGGNVEAVVPLPRKKRHFVVPRSPHVHKKSQERYVLTSFHRLINMEPSSDQINDLMKLSLPDGVEVVIRILES